MRGRTRSVPAVRAVPGTSHAGSNRGSSNPTSAYAASDVRFVPERSEVWFTDQDRGFFITRFADDPATGKPLWPFASG